MSSNIGRLCYKVIPVRKFESAEEYDRALAEFCETHGCVTEGPGDDSPYAKALKKEKEKIFQLALHTSKAVRDTLIGLDPEDRERIEVLWTEEFVDVRIVTFCGISNHVPGQEQVDYTDKAKAFAKEFFGADVWELCPEDVLF